MFFLEVSERREAEEQVQQAGRRLALLTQVSSDLAGVLTHRCRHAPAPGLLVPGLADGCLVTVFDDQGHPAQPARGTPTSPGTGNAFGRGARVPGLLLRGRTAAAGAPAGHALSSPGRCACA